MKTNRNLSGIMVTRNNDPVRRPAARSLWREALIVAVNQAVGYRYPLRLLSPLEVEDEGEV